MHADGQVALLGVVLDVAIPEGKIGRWLLSASFRRLPEGNDMRGPPYDPDRAGLATLGQNKLRNGTGCVRIGITVLIRQDAHFIGTSDLQSPGTNAHFYPTLAEGVQVKFQLLRGGLCDKGGEVPSYAGVSYSGR